MGGGMGVIGVGRKWGYWGGYGMGDLLTSYKKLLKSGKKNCDLVYS